jgi:hypothetical protein
MARLLGETKAGAFTILKLMGHGTVTVLQRYAHPSPEAMSHRMEGWNTARLRGVGPDSGTVAQADSAREVASLLE